MRRTNRKRVNGKYQVVVREGVQSSKADGMKRKYYQGLLVVRALFLPSKKKTKQIKVQTVPIL